MLDSDLIQNSRNLRRLAHILQTDLLSDDEMSQRACTLVSATDDISSQAVKYYYAMPPLAAMKSKYEVNIQQGMTCPMRENLLRDMQKLPTFFTNCLLSSNDTRYPITDYLHAFLLSNDDAVREFMLKVCTLGKNVSRVFDISNSPPLTFRTSNASILRELVKIECCILTLIIQVRSLFEYSFQVYSALTHLLPASIVSLEDSGYDSIKTLSTVLDILSWASDEGKAVFYMTFRMAIFSVKQRNQHLYHRILQLIVTKIGLSVENPLMCIDTLSSLSNSSNSRSLMYQVHFLIFLHILCSSDIFDGLSIADQQKLELSIQGYYATLINDGSDKSISVTNPNYMYEVHLLIQLLRLKCSAKIQKN